MHSQYISAVGLLMDIAGAFLLAAEAIKIPNLLTLRDKFVSRFSEEIKSPPIYFVDDDGRRRVAAIDRRIFGNRHPMVFTALHYVAGAIVVALSEVLSNGWLSMMTWHLVRAVLLWRWYFSAPVLLISGLYLIVGGLWMLGEGVHVGLLKSVNGAVSVLSYIETNTESGTIGVIGFALLFVGFILQMIGTLSSVG